MSPSQASFYVSVVHYSDVILSAMASQITTVSIFLLNRLFRCRSTKTSELRVTGLYEGNPPVISGFPHKGPVARKLFEWSRHGKCMEVYATVCNCKFVISSCYFIFWISTKWRINSSSNPNTPLGDTLGFPDTVTIMWHWHGVSWAPFPAWFNLVTVNIVLSATDWAAILDSYWHFSCTTIR